MLTLVFYYAPAIAAYLFHYADDSARYFMLAPREEAQAAGSWYVTPLTQERAEQFRAGAFVLCGSEVPKAAHFALESFFSQGYSIASPVRRLANGNVYRAFCRGGGRPGIDIPNPNGAFYCNLVRNGRGYGATRLMDAKDFVPGTELIG
jgi:hypothetical protein